MSANARTSLSCCTETKSSLTNQYLKYFCKVSPFAFERNQKYFRLRILGDSVNPRFDGGILEFMDGIPNFMDNIHNINTF